jgi:hypothetical protein
MGDVATWLQFDGGPVVASGTGVNPEADIHVERRYRLAMLERLGLIDSLESLEGGGIGGAQGTLMFFLGMWDTDECVQARRTLATPQDAALGVLGDVLSSAAWNVIARRLAEEMRLDSADTPCPS